MSQGWLLAGAEEPNRWSEPGQHSPLVPANDVVGSGTGPAPAVMEVANPPEGPDDDDTWRNDAACRSTSPDLFFPVGATGIALVEIAAAKFVCSQCAVRKPCLEFALDNKQEYGVWGGFSEEERRILRRRRRPTSRTVAAAAAAAPAVP